jgi:glycine betaine catabolism B
MRVIFDHSEPTAANIRTFWFKPEHAVRFTAGQFTELYLPHDNPDDRGVRRWFTISSSPTDNLVSITTKFATHDGSTFKQTLARLPEGTPLHLADPLGDFVLPKDKSLPLVFVAGGIGVTPMHSMIKYLHDTGEQRDILLIYAVTDSKELAFREQFEAYGVKLIPVVKDPAKGYTGETGSLDADRILQLAQGDDGRKLFYLSGPEPMVEAFTETLKQRGVDKHRVVTDYFPGYAKF